MKHSQMSKCEFKKLQYLGRNKGGILILFQIEQEVKGMLNVGFTIIMGIAVL